MLPPKIENPWNVQTIYAMQYYVCPSCTYKHISKQNFMCHAFDTHPESVDYMKNIKDGSLSDILCPWDSNNGKINHDAEEIISNVKEEFDDNNDLHFFEDETYIENDLQNSEYSKTKTEFGTTSKDPLESKTQNIEYDLKNSKDIHEGKTDFKCYSCIRFFPSKQSFQEHISYFHNLEGEKTNKKGKKCDLCGKNFYGTMERHIEAVHKPKQLTSKTDFKCDSCNKKYSSAQKLKQHIHTVHVSNKKVKKDDVFCVCDLCGKSMYSRSLKKHIQFVHEQQRNFKCDSCEKSFAQSGGLKKHIKTTHEGHKDFICDSCGKSFTLPQSLKKHIHIVHEGRKDHCCESCGKAFSIKDLLKMHIQTIHEGRKDYGCTSCTKSFGTQKILTRHINVVHKGIKNKKCSFCDKAFGTNNDLKRHIKRCHSQEKTSEKIASS